MTDTQKAISLSSKKPTFVASHIEIACDNLLLLGTEGLSKTGAHALFSDGAFNTTVSKIHKRHGIFLARETRTKINKRGVATHPMFYWIEDKTMAYQVVKLTNHLKQQRGAATQTLDEVEKFMANFPDEASTNRNLNKEAS